MFRVIDSAIIWLGFVLCMNEIESSYLSTVNNVNDEPQNEKIAVKKKPSKSNSIIYYILYFTI